ncbi:MAG: Ku protein [Sphingobacteriales bacterium]|nr:MAG: Ku protein [Sphingobacteriales bacterium]
MRAIWTGAIGFGLVNIPVKIYTATATGSIDLDMLDSRDHANIHFKRVNANTGKEVAWEDIVKGFLKNDQYIILEDEDFEAALPEKSKILSIDSFVPEEEIDSIYFENPYFLEPQKGGEAAYSLLLRSLMQTSMVAVGTFVLRQTEALCIVRVYDDNILLLHRLRFQEEIRDYQDLKIPAYKAPKPAELKMAKTLIKEYTDSFDPSMYKNNYQKALMRIINQKSKGKKISRKPVPVESSKVTDLMEQLKASLTKPKTTNTRKPKPATTPKRKRSTKA